MNCSIKVTGTSKVKYTVTVNGDLRIKMNESHLSDKEMYEEIGNTIRKKLSVINRTMRGSLGTEKDHIIMFNDSKTISVRIDFNE